MRKPGNSRIIYFALCVLILCSVLCVPASADMGPKASVHIDFKNMGDEICYATLLSYTPSTGPSSVWDGNYDHAYHNENESSWYYGNAILDFATWKKFVEYADADGYYFLQENVYDVGETKQIHWGYYPPNKFKILLYYPETDKFVVSDILERYAFDTYYTVDMQGVDIGSVDYDEENSTNDCLIAYKTYQWQTEAVSLVARMVLTILIEMGFALLFGFRQKKPLVFLAIVNVTTQVILNVILNIIDFNSGSLAFTLAYINLEIAVFAIEAILYCILMNRYTEKPRSKLTYVFFSLAANAVSFCAGLALYEIIPTIF